MLCWIPHFCSSLCRKTTGFTELHVLKAETCRGRDPAAAQIAIGGAGGEFVHLALLEACLFQGIDVLIRKCLGWDCSIVASPVGQAVGSRPWASAEVCSGGCCLLHNHQSISICLPL
jgi:hypothetical protein